MIPRGKRTVRKNVRRKKGQVKIFSGLSAGRMPTNVRFLRDNVNLIIEQGTRFRVKKEYPASWKGKKSKIGVIK